MTHPIDSITLAKCADPANKAETMLMSFNSEGLAYDPNAPSVAEAGVKFELNLG